MLEKIRDFCDKKFEKSAIDVGYYIICLLYYFIQVGLFVLFGCIFHNFEFIIIGTIITFVINSYTYTHHCHVLEHCILLTQTSFIVFGIISKNASVELSLFISFLAIRYIYMNSPIERTYKEKDEDWHRYKALKYLFLFLLISLALLKFEFYDLSKSILWSITMTGVLMVENKMERV